MNHHQRNMATLSRIQRHRDAQTPPDGWEEEQLREAEEMDCEHCGTKLREDGTGYHHSAACPVTIQAEAKAIAQELAELTTAYNNLCDISRHQGADICALKEALRPFANYACDPPCGCHNCRAKELL